MPRSSINIADQEEVTGTTPYTLRELFDAGVPREELIDAIARGKLGSVIAGRDHESTLVGRAEVLSWLDEHSDAGWVIRLQLPGT